MAKLRQEAYADLHTQLQHYNDEFITRMRYEENLNSLSSTDSSFSESSQDTSIQELAELFETGTVKDYSQLIEWESFKVSFFFHAFITLYKIFMLSNFF